MTTLDLGIKALTTLAPFAPGSLISLASPPGHGALVLLLETLHRADARLLAMGAASRTRTPAEFDAMWRDGLLPERVETVLLDPADAAEVRTERIRHALVWRQDAPPPDVVVLDVVALQGLDPEALLAGRDPRRTVVLFEALATQASPDPVWHGHAQATWRFSTELARQGVYPALDLEQTYAPGAWEGARALARARPAHLSSYLSQPFEIAEYYTGLPGNRIPAPEVVRDLERLRDADLSAVDPEGLRFLGRLPERL